MRVLLLEDEAAAAKSIETMLRGQGHECEIAEHGGEAVELAMANAYDIILLDVRVPDIDVYEALHRLRTANVQTPILIQSGLADRAEKTPAPGLGVEDYLIEPFDRAELSDLMDRVLSQTETDEDTRHGPANDKDGPSPQSERRVHKRSKIIKWGQIVYQSANCVMGCAIMDISEGGALLKPEDPIRCPKDFVLKIKSGPTHKCQTCWHYKDKVGVRFLETTYRNRYPGLD